MIQTWRGGLRLAVVAAVALLGAGRLVSAQVAGYQDYFVLGYDQHIWNFMERVRQGEAQAAFPAPARINSVVSLATTVDNQVVYYDQWEDGYETDANLLAGTPAQNTTLVLGDGNSANGRACDFTTDPRVYPCNGNPAHDDALFAGTPLVFHSDQGLVAAGCNKGITFPAVASLATVFCSVPVNPRANTDVRFDGGDRIFTSGAAITIAHVYDPGITLIGGATELLPRTLVAPAVSFSVPVGENLFALGANYASMKYASLDLVAFDDNTQVTVNSPGAGTVSFTLNRGQHWTSCATWVAGAGPTACTAGAIDGVTNAALVLKINASTKISTTGPLNAMIYTGGPGGYADYQYAVLPDLLHSTDFVITAPGATGGNNPNLYIFNPDPANTNTVTVTDNTGTGSFTIAPASVVDYVTQMGRNIPANSTVRLRSSTNFWGVSTYSQNSTISDWGHSWLATRFLTTDYTVAYSPGTQTYGITNLTWAGGTATATTAEPVVWAVGTNVQGTVFGATPAGYNGRFLITVTAANQFTYPLAANPGAVTTLPTLLPGPCDAASAATVAPCNSFDRNPVWVSATQNNTQVRIDLNNDGQYDFIDTDSDNCPNPGDPNIVEPQCQAPPVIAGCPALTAQHCVYVVNAPGGGGTESLRIFDYTDLNNAGTHIVTSAPVAVSWGQDVDQGQANDPSPDSGYTVYPSIFVDPVVSIDKAANTPTIPLGGGNVTYTLTVKTYSFSPLTLLTVTDLLPTGIGTTYTGPGDVDGGYVPGSTVITYPDLTQSTGDPTTSTVNGRSQLAWGIGTPTFQTNQTLTIQYTVNYPAGTAARLLTNNAQATARKGGSVFTSRATATVAQTAISIVKTEADDGQPEVGDTLTYALTVTNNGAVSETGITVTDPIPPFTTFLGPATTQGNFTAAYSSGQNAVVWSSTVSGAAQAITSITRGGTGNLTATANSTNHGFAVGMTVTITGATPAGFNGTYTITSVPNANQFTYQLTTDPGGNAGAATATPPPQLKPGESVTFTFPVTIDAGTDAGSVIPNYARYSSNLTPSALSNTTTTTVVAPVLSISKTGSPNPLHPNQVATFVITVRNSGGATAQDVRISDALASSNATYVPGSMSWSSNGTPFVALTDVAGDDPGTLTGTTLHFGGGAGFGTTVNLGPGQDIRFQFQARVSNASPAVSSVANQATVSSTQTGSIDSNLVQIPVVGSPANSMVTGHVFLDAGGTSGVQDASDPDLANVKVVITDSTGVAQTVLTDAFGNFSVQMVAGTVTCDVDQTDAHIPAGSSLTTANDPQTQTAPAGGAVACTAFGFRPPPLSISKKSNSGGAAVYAGETLTYTVTVTNDTGQTQTGIALTDALPAGVSWVSGSTSVRSSSGGDIRVTEYPFTSAAAATTFNLTLNQALATNYFVIVQGSDAAANVRTPAQDYVSLTGAPATYPGVRAGDLAASLNTSTLAFTRQAASGAWSGVITVVECLANCTTDGFQLIDVKRIAHAAGALGPTTIAATNSWGAANVGQIVPIGGYNGAGCDTTDTDVPDHKSCQIQLSVSGANSITWTRDLNGTFVGVGSAATSTVMAVQWGSSWSVQHATVTNGNNGGAGVNAVGEYNTAAISPVTRYNTWVWGTGTANGVSTSASGEGAVITLGDGVNQNATENKVAVGSEVAGASLNFDVYTMTHPNLAVDYRFLASGNAANSTVAVATDTVAVPGNHFGLVYNTVSVNTTPFSVASDSGGTKTLNVSSLVHNALPGTTATATTTVAHGWITNTAVTVAGATPNAYNGPFNITVTGGTTFTYLMGSNPGSNDTTVAATTITGPSTTATVTTAAPHGWTTGMSVTIGGATGTNAADFNGTFVITVTGPNTFTYTMPAAPTVSGNVPGTLTATGPDTNYPRAMLAAQYTTASNIQLSRNQNGDAFAAWVQGINFDAVPNYQTFPQTAPNGDPNGTFLSATACGGVACTIPSGSTLTVTYNVLVGNPAGVTITNTATAHSTQQPANVQASVTDTLVRPGVSIDPDNAGFVKSRATDQTITFYHVVKNTGTAADSFNLTAKNEAGWKVQLIDPASGAVIATDSNGDGVWDGGAIVNTGTLAAGGTRSYYVRLTVPGGTPATVPPMTPMTTALTAVSTTSPFVTAKGTDEVTVLAAGAGGVPGQNGVNILPDQSGSVANTAGSTEVYTHTIVNTTGAAEVFDITAQSTLGWSPKIYFDSNGDGVFTPGVDTQITNTASIPNGGSQKIFIVVTVPAGGVPAGTTDVTLVRVQGRTNTLNYDVVSDTTTAVAPTAVDLSGGGTRYASQNDVTIYPGTISNFGGTATRFNLSITPSSLFGVDGLLHPTELWVDTNGDGIVDTKIATDLNGDGTWDTILGGVGGPWDTNGDGVPDVLVPAAVNGVAGTLAYELRRTIPSAQVRPQEFVTLTASSLTTPSQADSVTAQFLLVSVTRATLLGLKVDAAGGLVEFATGDQQGTRGFNLYEVHAGPSVTGLQPLNAAMIASPIANSLTPILYEAHTRPITLPYLMIEEIEVTGQRRLMGPFSVQDPVLTRQLERVRMRLAAAGDGVQMRGDSRRLTLRGLRRLAAQESGPARRALQDWRASRSQFAAGGAKVRVSAAGDVRVSLTQLQAAGLPGSAQELRLTHFGQPVPFTRNGDWVTFTASALSTDYTGQNVYVFTHNFPAAAPEVSLTRSEAPPAANVRRIERDALYDPHIPFGLDPWFWDMLLPGYGSWPYSWSGPDFGSFDLPNLPAALPAAVPVHVQVLGGTDHLHQVTASINGIVVGSVTMTGPISSGTISGTVPASVLRATGNQLNIDYAPLALPAGPPADWAVAGLNYVDLELPIAGRPAATFELEGYDSSVGDLRGADYLIVTHPLFQAQADRLADVERAHGYTTAVVDVERAYDRFSGGIVEAEAVRALIRYAAATSGRLKYVLLLGDDTFDPQDFMGLGSVSYVPSLLSFDTLFGRIPSENLYADLNGDGVPDLAIGRLPAQTAAQADTMIDKIVAYWATPRSLADRHFFVADNSTETDAPFRQEAVDMAAKLPVGSSISFVDVQPDMAAARADLAATWASGAFAAHYFGHGNPTVWADEQILTSDAAAGLTTSRPPIVFQWACLTGWYQYLYGPSLGEALVTAAGGGAVATFAPTGITSPGGQRELFEQVYQRFRTPPATLGELIRQSKAATLAGNPSLRPIVDGWNLLGDPALPLAPLAP
jgi:uncharacterized repeat protein (TIGR01451 family)